MERKVVLYIAQSLDGFIATEDHDISWLSIVEQEGEDYGYEAFVDTVDTVFMGRRTYEKVLSFGVEFPHKGRKCYVLSASRKGSDENVTFFRGDLKALVEDIKKKEGELKDQAEKRKGAVKAKADDFSKDALSKADEMKSRAENAVQGAKDGFKKDPAAKK